MQEKTPHDRIKMKIKNLGEELGFMSSSEVQLSNIGYIDVVWFISTPFKILPVVGFEITLYRGKRDKKKRGSTSNLKQKIISEAFKLQILNAPLSIFIVEGDQKKYVQGIVDRYLDLKRFKVFEPKEIELDLQREIDGKTRTAPY